MSNPNTIYTQNGIEAEKHIEDMTTSAYQVYQDNGAEADRYAAVTAHRWWSILVQDELSDMPYSPDDLLCWDI